MKKVLIIKNITREGPGLLASALKAAGFELEIVDLSAGDHLPDDPKDYAGVVVLGGPQSGNDTDEITPWMQQELLFAEETLEAAIPYLGICLGMQILAKAAGSQIVPNTYEEEKLSEIGFRDKEGLPYVVDLMPAGRKDPLFKDLESPFRVFHLHAETILPSENVQLLGVGKWCENQVIRVGANAYGLQCHFELTPDMFEDWVNQDPDLSKLNRSTLMRNWKEEAEAYTKTGETLMRNWVSQL